jgi:rhodanese-related sulfurtransferase
MQCRLQATWAGSENAADAFGITEKSEFKISHIIGC